MHRRARPEGSDSARAEHTVRLYWENVYSRLAVKIQSLELQSLGGPDNNGNGTKDWIETAIAAMAGVDTSTFDIPCSEFDIQQYYVSSACIEGDTRYVEFMDLAFQSSISNLSSQIPRRGAGARWYANLPLLDAGDATPANASFQNGALEVPMSVKWMPYNLIDHDGETITIRKGDALRLTCIDPARAFEDLEHARGGQFEIALDITGNTYSSPNTRPITVAFTNAGSFTVSGDYIKGNNTLSASVNVVVIDASFPEASPACLVGKERTWSFEGMPSSIAYEVDDTVDLEVLPQTPDSSLQTVALCANDTNGEDYLLTFLARRGEPHNDYLELGSVRVSFDKQMLDVEFIEKEKGSERG